LGAAPSVHVAGYDADFQERNFLVHFAVKKMLSAVLLKVLWIIVVG